MAETRTTEGTTKVFGGPMSAAVLYVKRDWLEKNPNTVQALANAFYKTLQWLDKATPEQIADNVPQEYWLGDKALYIAGGEGQHAGLFARWHRQRREPASARSISSSSLTRKSPAANIDPAKTWDDRFVKKAAANMR